MRLFVVLKRDSAVAILLCLITLPGAFFLFRSLESIPSLRRTPGTFYMVHTQNKVVALTFDDGPDPLFTGQVLDILKQQQVKATFFVLGQGAAENPGLVARIHAEGHEIGNHGFTHDYRQRKLVAEIVSTDKAVFEAAGVHTRFYRPPGGGVNKEQLEQIKLNGHIVALWSLDSRDWLNPGSKQIVRSVTRGAFPGAIILLHDGGEKRGQTVMALEPIIAALRAQDYRFVTLSELYALARNDDTLPTGSGN